MCRVRCFQAADSLQPLSDEYEEDAEDYEEQTMGDSTEHSEGLQPDGLELVNEPGDLDKDLDLDLDDVAEAQISEELRDDIDNADDVELVPCPTCQQTIPVYSSPCPHCNTELDWN